ncbi:hypothetical protein BDV30DRAFT_191460 [Aspergillus minisclerotigenes]|uniref:Uncharacterized protein n=1 Tax=Aspergillus minisclerotigenes TaxID=656917 RepID=A0A5N6ITK3_9EURO|nr:hypothetical protein BDV30DRAFT_191460 [Aspergillus minisclerotigenes]
MGGSAGGGSGIKVPGSGSRPKIPRPTHDNWRSNTIIAWPYDSQASPLIFEGCCGNPDRIQTYGDNDAFRFCDAVSNPSSVKQCLESHGIKGVEELHKNGGSTLLSSRSVSILALGIVGMLIAGVLAEVIGFGFMGI